MDEKPTICPRCGKPLVENAVFCAYCGLPAPAAAPPPPAAQRARAIPVPDRAGLRGKCSVIYAGTEEMDIRRVGRLVAEAVGRPLPDVTRELKASKGFLATGLEAAKATALAEQAEKDLSAPVIVTPDEAAPALPEMRRMRNVAVTPDGLGCEAYSWDQTETVRAGWDEVFVISCGRLEVQEVIEARDEGEPGGYSMRRLPPLVTVTHYEFLLDIVLFDPWRRLRLDQNAAGFSLTEMQRDAGHAVGTLCRLALNLERMASGAPRNRGVALLAAGAADAAWETLTFSAKRDFDAYTRWLMQLVRYGRMTDERVQGSGVRVQ